MFSSRASLLALFAILRRYSNTSSLHSVTPFVPLDTHSLQASSRWKSQTWMWVSTNKERKIQQVHLEFQLQCLMDIYSMKMESICTTTKNANYQQSINWSLWMIYILAKQQELLCLGRYWPLDHERTMCFAYLLGKHSSIAAISASEKSTIIFLGFHKEFSFLIIFRTSEIEPASSFSGMKTATTI